MEQKDESFEDLLANLENSRVTIEKSAKRSPPINRKLKR